MFTLFKTKSGFYLVTRVENLVSYGQLWQLIEQTQSEQSSEWTGSDTLIHYIAGWPSNTSLKCMHMANLSNVQCIIVLYVFGRGMIIVSQRKEIALDLMKCLRKQYSNQLITISWNNPERQAVPLYVFAKQIIDRNGRRNYKISFRKFSATMKPYCSIHFHY